MPSEFATSGFGFWSGIMDDRRGQPRNTYETHETYCVMAFGAEFQGERLAIIGPGLALGEVETGERLFGDVLADVKLSNAEQGKKSS